MFPSGAEASEASRVGEVFGRFCRLADTGSSIQRYNHQRINVPFVLLNYVEVYNFHSSIALFCCFISHMGMVRKVYPKQIDDGMTVQWQKLFVTPNSYHMYMLHHFTCHRRDDAKWLILLYSLGGLNFDDHQPAIHPPIPTEDGTSFGPEYLSFKEGEECPASGGLQKQLRWNFKAKRKADNYRQLSMEIYDGYKMNWQISIMKQLGNCLWWNREYFQ